MTVCLSGTCGKLNTFTLVSFFCISKEALHKNLRGREEYCKCKLKIVFQVVN